MKAEHRHELKTNELAQWIAAFPQWARENLRMVAVVGAVVLLAAGSFLYYRYQKKAAAAREQLNLTELATRLWMSKRTIIGAQQQGADVSYMLLQLAENLQAFALNAREPRRAAFAFIERAEALRAELHYRAVTVSTEELTRQINLAKDSYNAALDKAGSDPTVTAMARFGLGLCEEELGGVERARQTYLDIVANPDFAYTTSAVQAKHRLATMGEYEPTIMFRSWPQPFPPPSEATVPMIVPEVNLPAVNLPPGLRPAVLEQPNNLVPAMPPVETNLVNTGPADVNSGTP